MKRFIIIFLCMSFFTGCGVFSPKSASFSPPTLGYDTTMSSSLQALPKPKGKISVSVYNFRDQTGQYKFHPTSSSFSTAMTQGATSMLIQSLITTGWFVPLEREGLNNLLTERKIIRAKTKGKNGDADDPGGLRELISAPIILEGGIIAYETNVSTGGLGAKYFGAGGSAQYRKDQVTLYLRAVNVARGEILKSVSASKSIMSTEVDAGVFRFVDYKRLLEGEIGFTTNEPTQLCVLEAIEKSVLSLIVDGIIENLWEIRNPEEIRSKVVVDYLNEKYGEERAKIVVENYLKSKNITQRVPDTKK